MVLKKRINTKAEFTRLKKHVETEKLLNFNNMLTIFGYNFYISMYFLCSAKRSFYISCLKVW